MKIILHRTHRDDHYATINLTCVEDPRLSGLAKALHLYALSRPEGWELHIKDLARRFEERKAAFEAAFKQLEEAGYLVRLQEQGQRGQFGTFVCHWYEEPVKLPPREEPISDNPISARPVAAGPRAVKPPPSNNQGRIDQGVCRTSRTTGYSPEFEVFWEAYPRRIAKRGAWQCWNARLNDGTPTGDMLLSCGNYRDHVKREGISLRYVMHAATFLGPNLRYQDWLEPPKGEKNGSSGSKTRGPEGRVDRDQYRKAVLGGGGG